MKDSKLGKVYLEVALLVDPTAGFGSSNIVSLGSFSGFLQPP